MGPADSSVAPGDGNSNPSTYVAGSVIWDKRRILLFSSRILSVVYIHKVKGWEVLLTIRRPQLVRHLPAIALWRGVFVEAR